MFANAYRRPIPPSASPSSRSPIQPTPAARDLVRVDNVVRELGSESLLLAFNALGGLHAIVVPIDVNEHGAQ
jgi:hypothetical protein